MPQFGPIEIPLRRWTRWSATFALICLIVFLCGTPQVESWRFPSLFDDDLTRVGALRRGDFPAALFRPFNEHLAPLFELVSWLAWWAVGQRVDRVATGFLVASYVAWGVTLTALGAVVRLELRSSRAAVFAVTSFALATVSIETLLWYSASSFQWAAATGLVSWFAVVQAARAPSRWHQLVWLTAAALGALASPLFSAIGVLAGPLGSLRGLVREPGSRPRRSWWSGRVAPAAVPWLGTAAYLLVVAAQPAHGLAVAASARSHVHWDAAAWAILRAPGAVLAPMLVGLPSLSGVMPDLGAAILTIALIPGIVVWAVRSPARGLIVTGLGWVVGGYAVAYLARAVPGDRWIFEVGRYHLFPQLGATCLLAALLGPWLDRAEARRPGAGWVIVVLFTGLSCLVQGPKIADASRRSFRFPDQPRAITAAIHLEAACAAEGVPLTQAIRIIEPTRPRWFPRPLPFNPLLYLFDDRESTVRYPDSEARTRVRARLGWDDRAAIWGGMDADRDRASPAGLHPVVTPVSPSRTGEVTTPGEGRLFFEEFAVPPELGINTGLDLDGVAPGTAVEVWWADVDQAWWSGRSIRWTMNASPLPLVLARLPHWQPSGRPGLIRVVRRNRPFAFDDRPILLITTQP